MLRVYAHAASLNGKELVVTGISDEASVKCHDCVLASCFHPETGEATWRVTQPEQETWGEFRIEEDGTLTFPAGPKPLDTAAIDWVEHVVRATSPAADKHLAILGYLLKSNYEHRDQDHLQSRPGRAL